ncbi:MAG: transporter permease [Glaciihabitans sp.]|nr:transporter permease [Glaciihabitans sp.]
MSDRNPGATDGPPPGGTPRTPQPRQPHAPGQQAPGWHTPAWIAALLRSPGGIYGVFILAALVLSATVSLFWTPYDPARADPYQSFLPPSPEHWFGTDNSGRDILSRLLTGAQTTLVVAAGSAAIAAVVGVGFALLGSLTPRWVRESVTVLIDVLIAFPTVLLAMMLASVFGGSTTVVIVAVGASFGVIMGRIARSELRRVAASDYVLAARASGARAWSILIRHLLPNVAPILIVQLSLAAAIATLSEAALSYLGYGAPPGTPSWGRMLSELQQYISIEPLTVLWPGIVITLTVLGFNQLGDALRDATDPRQKRAPRVRKSEKPR